MLMVVDDVVVVDPENQMLHIIFTFQRSRGNFVNIEASNTKELPGSGSLQPSYSSPYANGSDA